MGGKQQHVANWGKFLDGLIGRKCNTSVKHMDRIYHNIDQIYQVTKFIKSSSDLPNFGPDEA